MEYVKRYNTNNLIKTLLGNNIHFISDCMLFPKQGISGKIIEYRISATGEIIFKVKVKSGKVYDVGSNTSNLQFEFI
jgi:hypothetical protein